MKRVVERCPSCGVEHDHSTHECEACGNAVRHWCRTHSREIGWLDGPACIRCDEEEARRTGRPWPPPAPPPPPPVAPPTPVDANDGVPAGHVARATARDPKSILAERLRKAAEKPPEAPATAPPASAVTTPPPDVARVPVPTAAPSPEPVGDRAADAETRPRLAVRLFDGLLTALQTGIVGVLFGVVIGGIRAYRIGAEVPLEAAIGGALGGMAGLALGVLIAIVLFLFPIRQRGP